MEAHPAHNSLPAKAKIEAMDVLTWAWTGNNGFFYPFPLLLLNFFLPQSVSFPHIVLFLPLSLKKNAKN
jgi:hypothetical protein